MSSQHEFNKLHGKLISLVKEVLNIDDKIVDFIEKGSQVELDNLCNSVDSVDKKWGNMKVALFSLIKSLSGDENSIISDKTDNGTEI